MNALRKYVYEILAKVELVALSEDEAQQLLKANIQTWSNETDVAIEVRECKLIAEEDYESPFEGNTIS